MYAIWPGLGAVVQAPGLASFRETQCLVQGHIARKGAKLVLRGLFSQQRLPCRKYKDPLAACPGCEKLNLSPVYSAQLLPPVYSGQEPEGGAG